MDSISRLARRLLLMVGRGRVRQQNDTGNVQTLQIQLNDAELRDGTPRLAEFGFTSNPPLGADAIVLFIGGDRSNAVVVATGDQKTRFKNLKPGESALYDAFGKSIYLTKDNGIVVDAANANVTVNNAAAITINASGDVNLTSDGVVTVTANTVNVGGTGGKKIAVDGDPVVAGVIQASTTKATAL